MPPIRSTYLVTAAEDILCRPRDLTRTAYPPTAVDFVGMPSDVPKGIEGSLYVEVRWLFAW